MITIRKTITVTAQQDAWIKSQIEDGHYTNDSECIRDLIRREQERNAVPGVIREALIEGENSGKQKKFNATVFKQQMQKKRG